VRLHRPGVDGGDGFDPAATAIEPERSPLDPSRGVLLMRALVDRLAFVLNDDGRHRVTPEKSLHISPKLRLLPQ
jgi:hypothetical protein